MTVRDSLPHIEQPAGDSAANDDPQIFLVRHGETLWNREGRMQGRLDSPLTRLGQDQARRMGETLAEVIGDPAGFTLVSSPLGRAYHTMELIAGRLGLPPAACRIDRRLKEMSWGQWDGLTLHEIERYFPDELEARARNTWRYSPPGGESYSMVLARVRPFLDEAVGHGRLIIVAHGVVVQVLRGLYAGLRPEEIVSLPEPSEAVFRLIAGAVDTYAAEAA